MALELTNFRNRVMRLVGHIINSYARVGELLSVTNPRNDEL
jgi:hypothetical protein